MTLTVKQRLAALSEGKFIRRDNWMHEARTDGVTVFINNGNHALSDLNRLSIFQDSDTWELYKEPSLEITEHDVGRVALLRNGSRTLIAAFTPTDLYPVKTYYGTHKKNGCRGEKEESQTDIVKLLGQRVYQ